ncbi:MAG: hypothetical protein KatS3mg114_0736 [Planctomycetaceae bacterium]|nr:MAG: hypothetical protein KatS3mg114_0736 [Planctomycetaceae bacterium]
MTGMKVRCQWWWQVSVCWLVLVLPVSAQTIARCGAGWLEKIDGTYVLHLKGTPYEMGYQHGVLLREHVRKNMQHLVVEKPREMTLVKWGPIEITPRAAIEMILKIEAPYIDPRYEEEMRGLADGAEVSLADVRAGNFIPELFHCSGFALSNSATVDGELYHGRVLDYAVDWGLQEHAVIVVCEPEGRVPWVNISYAGFIGSVTGMNAETISIGEMGGGGLGHWEGRPMALIVREALESARTLEEAIAVFRDGPRTCQYFYVIGDGRSRRAVGMEASWDVFQVIEMGQPHERLPHPVRDCVLMSAGGRYEELTKRAKLGHGRFTPEDALRLMDRPVAMSSNLHNVLFVPKRGDFWVAQAAVDGRPAAEQPYQKFNLRELLARRPESTAPERPYRAKQTTAAAN